MRKNFLSLCWRTFSCKMFSAYSQMSTSKWGYLCVAGQLHKKTMSELDFFQYSEVEAIGTVCSSKFSLFLYKSFIVGKSLRFPSRNSFFTYFTKDAGKTNTKTYKSFSIFKITSCTFMIFFVFFKHNYQKTYRSKLFSLQIF